MISSLSGVLLRSVLFNLQVFLIFRQSFLLLISHIILLWSESIHCIIYTLFNLLRCQLWPIMLSILVMYCVKFRRMYSTIIGLVVCKYQLYLVAPLPADLSISGRGALKSPNSNNGFIYFLQYCQFLPCIFWCFIVRCMYFKDHSALFLKNWPF